MQRYPPRHDDRVDDGSGPTPTGHQPVVDGRLRRWLGAVFVLFALLAVNSTYLAAVTLLEYVDGALYQDYFYLSMFIAHLALGALLIVPFLVFAVRHLRRARRRPNRYAVRAGIALLLTGTTVIVSGVLLTRLEFIEINDPAFREPIYWLHVVAPFVAGWLFILHRLAGRPIQWRIGLRWAGVATGLAAVVIGWNGLTTPPSDADAVRAFDTTLIRTPGGAAISADRLMTDAFCAECHADIAAGWRHSAHRHSSFNNPFYAFSVNETREVSLQTSGTVAKAQFCAGCHDTVPLLSGAFDDPDFDTRGDPVAHAGLTCTSCHAISRVNSVVGNADFTIGEPVSYPFEHSDNPLLREISKLLIRAKPGHHKKGFLKPLHSTAEFCGSCHKAHVPESVNGYRWLRAQNHYDSFKQSGVSGHRVDSFYYPDSATPTCAACHMSLQVSDDPAARDFDGSGTRKIHSHLFPAANTALAHVARLPDTALAAHRRMLEGAARIDIFAVHEGGEIDGRLHAPLDRSPLVLEPGKRYLLAAVVRNRRVGHHLTQGTSDSNELWVDVSVRAGDRLIGRSGGMGPRGQTDPWSFFVNSYVLTRDGERLDRRNGQDTFVTLYNHQIPPGAAAVVHYALTIPDDVSGPVAIDAALRYRKFDTTYLSHVQGDAFERNDLPVVTLAADRAVLATSTDAAPLPATEPDTTPLWERWNDYGIGLLLAGNAQRSALRQAAQAFREVERLGRADGPLNLARVYLKEGRIADAASALQRAAERHADFRPWTRAWLTARVDRENGHLEQASATLRALLDTRFHDARARGFDFAFDYRARNLLGRTLYERSRQSRGSSRAAQRLALLQDARGEFERVLDDDPENLTAHFNLALIHADLGDDAQAAAHRARVAQYRPDDHAAERAVARHRRRNPAADHAAEAVAIYDLQRPGAYGLEPAAQMAASRARTGADPEPHDERGS